MHRLCPVRAILAMIAVLMFATLFTSAAPASAQFGSGDIQEICAGSPIPNGWVKINDIHSPITCGRPFNPQNYNVWIIQRHDNKFRGDRMFVCNPIQGAPAGFPSPNWSVENISSSPTSCGHPFGIGANNLAQIECLNCPVRPPDPQPTGPDYEGWFDAASCDVIAGWVWNKRAPNEPLRIDILANGAQIAQVVADGFRQDLQNTGRGDGRHAFMFPTPARLKNSRNNTITVRVTNTSFFIANGPKSFTCANPIDDQRFFVRQHYIDFLSREPDQAGWDHWTNEITQCGTDAVCVDYMRAQVSLAFFLSVEFQNTGYFAQRFYRASFARLPTITEFGTDKNLVGQGVAFGSPGWESTLNFNKLVFANTFASRSNFTDVYIALNNQQFVDQLFANAQVTPDTATRNDLIDGLNTGRYSRGAALRLVVEYQPFIDREFNPAFVMMQYIGYLRRHPADLPDGPTMPGYFFWLNKLNTEGDLNNAARAFILSPEYRNRFGSDQPWPGGTTTSMQAAQMSTQPDYNPLPPCQDWDGNAWCDPVPACQDWDGDGDWDYCG